MIHFNIAQTVKNIEELEEKASESGFWDDMEQAQKILQKTKNLKDKKEKYYKLVASADDLEVLIELADEAEDLTLISEIKGDFNSLTKTVSEMKIETLLSGTYDKNNAILSLHAGAGGTEAQDWVEMLFRMYCRWAEVKGFKTETIDYLAGDEAGIKSVTILIEGINAYGYIKAEKGVHRLVRISPFDASGRRHTSFASCDVMPELDDDIKVDINPDDLKIDTYRSSGAGGQHINKTESAIRITHIPTGIIVACQNERSQHKNKDIALKMLKAKLIEREEEEKKRIVKGIQGEQKDIAWGSQIRSYVFHPYNMVKDHRTGCETGNTTAVMDGDLDEFINEYLKMLSRGEIE